MMIHYAGRCYSLTNGKLKLKHHALILRALLERDDHIIRAYVSYDGHHISWVFDPSRMRNVKRADRVGRILHRLYAMVDAITHHCGERAFRIPKEADNAES